MDFCMSSEIKYIYICILNFGVFNVMVDIFFTLNEVSEEMFSSFRHSEIL